MKDGVVDYAKVFDEYCHNFDDMDWEYIINETNKHILYGHKYTVYIEKEVASDNTILIAIKDLNEKKLIVRVEFKYGTSFKYEIRSSDFMELIYEHFQKDSYEYSLVKYVENVMDIYVRQVVQLWGELIEYKFKKYNKIVNKQEEDN